MFIFPETEKRPWARPVVWEDYQLTEIPVAIVFEKEQSWALPGATFSTKQLWHSMKQLWHGMTRTFVDMAQHEATLLLTFQRPVGNPCSYLLLVGMSCWERRSNGFLWRIWSLGALEERSGWNLRVRLAVAGVRKSEDMEIRNPALSESEHLKKSKPILPNMSTRAGLVENKNYWPVFSPFQILISKGRKIQKHVCLSIFLGDAIGRHCCFPPLVEK